MYTSYQYGGRSDDLEYMQEVLKTAERLGDQAYINRIKAQIEEIKRIKSGSKEDPRRKRGQICKPGLPTMDPMSCRGDFMSKCVKDPKDDQYRCCSNVSGSLSCEEVESSGYGKAITPITPKTPSKPALKSVVEKVIQIQKSTPTPSQIPKSTPMPEATPEKTSDSDKRVISDYFELKMNILKGIEELRRLKVQKDKLVMFTGKVPELVFHSEQNNLDDCIRDESGKVLQC
jgi:hypothetical protein